MNSIWLPIIVIGLIMVLGMGGAIVSDYRDIKQKQRAEAMQAWLKARPIRKTRDDALLKVAEAFADSRITAAEHEEFVVTIEGAMTNAEIEDIVNRIVAVERPQ